MSENSRDSRVSHDRSADIVLLLDDAGDILWAGPSLASHGVDPAALIGEPAAEFFHKNDAYRFRAGHADAMRQPGMPVTVESLQFRGERAFCFSDDTFTCLPRGTGNSGTVVLVRVHRLTSPRSKAAQGESEEQLRHVVHLSQIGTFEHNHLTGELYWSPENRAIHGWRPGTPVTLPGQGDRPRTWDFIHPDDRERVAEAVRRAHAGHNDGLFDLEYRIVRKDGSTRWLVTRAQTFFEGEGDQRRPVRTVGAVQDVTIHRQAARELPLMKISVDKCNTGIYWINVDGCITYANEFACESLGRSREELLSLHVWDFDPSLSAEKWRASWERTKRSRSSSTRTRHLRKDGVSFPVETLGTYVSGDGEELIFVFARDITQREVAERERRLMHAAIEKSHTPFYTVTPEGRIVYANEHACRMLGMTRAQLLSLRTWDVDPQLDPELQRDTWERLKREGMLRSERSWRRADGSLVPVEITSNYVSFKDEEFILSFAQDVTERTRAELALRRSEERLRQAILIYNIGIFEHDIASGIVHCSDELREYLGLGEQQNVLYNDFLDALHPEDHEQMEQAIARGRDPTGDGKLSTQFRIVRPDGSVRWLEGRSQTFFAGEGANRHAVRVVGAIADITDRLKAEQQVNRKQRLESIGTLAGGIAHDLNNALTPILMTIDMLKQDYPTEGELLGTVEQCANRAADMVRHLLAYARGSEGRRVCVAPRQLVDELTRIIKGTFPKNIELRTHIADDLPEVRGDATQLHQVLLNLAVNARDAMPRGGVLTVDVKVLEQDELRRIPELRDAAATRYVALSVTDTGTGIASEDLDRIFDPFFTTKKPESGTGLGLFTVAGIVRGHGGHIQVQSQPGQGSTFTVFLPAMERRTDIETRRLIQPDFSGNGERVLYVDDEPAVCEAARVVLQRLNFEPVTALDGRAGLEKAVENGETLCAVVTDLNMPNMDGLAFARALRKVLPDVPLIVASGRPDAVPAEDLHALSVHVVLEKPFSQERLAIALQRALNSTPGRK